MARRGRMLGRAALAANLLWLAGLLVYFIRGAATGRGLYGLLMRWQLEAGDAYSEWPAIGAHLALAAPSLWLLSGHVGARERAAARTPAAARRLSLRRAWACFGLAGALLAAAIVCFVMAPPGRGQAEPVEINASQLLRGDYPANAPVRLWARPVPGADYAMRQLRTRVGSRETVWRGLLPLDDLPDPVAPPPAPTGPVAVFSEATGAASREPEQLAEVISVSGRVVKDGLPGLARRRLAEAGVTIATPHYVLRHDEEDGSGWLTGGWLSLFGALACGMIGAALLLRGLGIIPLRKAG